MIAHVNTFNDVLDGLRSKRRPPRVFWQFLALGNVGFQTVRRKIFSVQAIVSLMESNAMIMDDTTNINLMM
jgi:hypothetical protein